MDNFWRIITNKDKKGLLQFWLVNTNIPWLIRNYDCNLLSYYQCYLYTAGKMLMVSKKCKIYFGNAQLSHIAISISDFSLLLPFRYCSSNFAIIFVLGLWIVSWFLFCIAPCIVIALPTIATAIVVALLQS